MTARRLTGAAIALALMCDPCLHARAQEATDPADPDEARALAAALAGAGSLLDATAREALALASDSLGSPLLPADAGAPPRLVARWRAGRSGAGAATARLDFVARGMQAAVRGRRDGQAQGAVAAALRLDAGPVTVAGGRGGLEHGLGVLLAAPGRWQSLDAGSSLGPGVQGWAASLAAEGDAVPTLAGAEARAGVLALGAWSGRLGAGAPGSESIRCARLGAGGREGGGAVAVVAAGAERGAGGWIWRDAGRSRVAAEAAAWRAGPAEAPGRALVVWLRHDERRAGVEAQVAVAEAAGGPRLGRRPAALPGWDGEGWALRGHWRPRQGVGLRGLLAAGRVRDAKGAAPEETEGLRWELSARADGGQGWDLGLAVRQVGATRHGWEGRSPWLPPSALRRDERLQLLAEAAREAGDWRLRASARVLAQRAALDTTGAAPARRRALAQLVVDRRGPGGWSVRLAAAWAWGEAIDLQSAACPAPGLIAPRHWGAWSGERSLGVARTRGGWRLAAAVCLRRPAAAGGREVAEWSLAAGSGP